MNGFLKFIVDCFILFYPMKVFGKENIPEGGALFACNHFRAIDPGFIAKIYSKDIFFLAKKELFKNKLFSRILKGFGAIPIDRESPELKSMLEAVKVLKDGHKLTVFPEGTRNKSGIELQPIHSGAAFFAAKAKTPIVPIMFLRKPKAFRKTYIIIGEPFEFSDYYGKKLSQQDIKDMDSILNQKMVEQHKILSSMFNEKGKLIKRKKNAVDKG